MAPGTEQSNGDAPEGLRCKNREVRLTLDATYAFGSELSGVGIYSREMLFGLASANPDADFRFCCRPHRVWPLMKATLPPNCRRGIFSDSFVLPPDRRFFHGLNQRLPAVRFRRSICTFHDLFVMTGNYSSPEFRTRFTEQAREAAARADVIIAVSEFTASQVEYLLRVERSRIHVVHHGIRRLAAVSARREPSILFVGAIQHRKNVARLVEAFGSVPEPWRLILAGSPTGYGAAEALAAITASPARDRIEVTGYIPANQLAALYAQASVFAFPSLDEGFGMPVLEAMSMGVPVLASTRSALPEVCGDAALLVDPLNAEEIAAGLLKLTRNEDLRNKYRERGLSHAARFTWQNAVNRTWRIYLDLLN